MRPAQTVVVENIKMLLIARDWTQKQLAERMWVQTYELAALLKGKKPVTMDYVDSLARGFEVPVWVLFQDWQDPSPAPPAASQFVYIAGLMKDRARRLGAKTEKAPSQPVGPEGGIVGGRP